MSHEASISERIEHLRQALTAVNPDLPITDSGHDCVRSLAAELDGSFQRWEVQMQIITEQSRKLEEKFDLLKRHLSTEDSVPAPKSVVTALPAPTPDQIADRFTADEHRSFLDRCLRAIRREN